MENIGINIAISSTAYTLTLVGCGLVQDTPVHLNRVDDKLFAEC